MNDETQLEKAIEMIKKTKAKRMSINCENYFVEKAKKVYHFSLKTNGIITSLKK